MLRYTLLQTTAILLLLGVPVTALAHPGHGSSDPYTLLHYLLEPLHAVVLVATVLGLIWLRRRRRAEKQP